MKIFFSVYTFFSLFFFFFFFFQSLLDTCNFSSTLEKSGWRQKVFISSVLEPFNFSRARSNNCPLNFSRFSVPRTFVLSFSFFPFSRFPSKYARKEIARLVGFACWKLKFRSFLVSIRNIERKTLCRNSSKRRRVE